MGTFSVEMAPWQAVVLTLIVAKAVHVLYQHFTHPLYHIPGPRLAAWSNVLYSSMFLRGRQPYEILALHEKYGPVVRIAPNELSFSSPSSWEDIYGFRPGHKTFVKSAFYAGGSFAEKAGSIVGERDPGEHAKMRKSLSPAFSDASLKKQDGLISSVIDQFVTKVGAAGSDPKGINIVKWFNLMTFDIIGWLAFGESFEGLSSEEIHPEIERVTKALRQGALADTMSRFPWLAWLLKKTMPQRIQQLSEETQKHEAYVMSIVERRLSRTAGPPDFLTRTLEDTPDISAVQLGAHSSDFITAGSETTATALSCIIYYMLKTPAVEKKLKDEIRTAFDRYEDITAQNCARLPYLHAVCLEGMRIYAPLPLGLPRIVPEGGDTVDDIMLPEGTVVSTNPVAACLSSANWDKPFEFRPERWLEMSPKDALNASQPFSLGSRACMGRSLSWIEMSTTLSKLYFRYDFEHLNPDLDWHKESRMATLWQKPDLMVRLVPRWDQ
ncbi:cytochrome P450 [Xylariaceae sp. FL0594]|nr:cytochrome P450 [Xylariaceae sp. FL0594]